MSGLEAFLITLANPGSLPYRVDKLTDGRWVTLAWCGTDDAALKLVLNGVGGGPTRIVKVPAREYQKRWRMAQSEEVAA